MDALYIAPQTKCITMTQEADIGRAEWALIHCGAKRPLVLYVFLCIKWLLIALRLTLPQLLELVHAILSPFSEWTDVGQCNGREIS